jgi:hypothetical protein
MSAPTYTDPSRWELLRAVGLGITIAGGLVTVLLSGQLIAWQDPALALCWLGATAVGAALLMLSRSRLAAMWAANKPYLQSEAGSSVVRERREYEERTRWVGRVLLALFVVSTTAFLLMFSIRQCTVGRDIYCENLPKASDWLLGTSQTAAMLIGGAWAAVAYWHRRHQSETERIDQIVTEGYRRRRSDSPMAGTDRRSWE